MSLADKEGMSGKVRIAPIKAAAIAACYLLMIHEKFGDCNNEPAHIMRKSFLLALKPGARQMLSVMCKAANK